MSFMRVGLEIGLPLDACPIILLAKSQALEAASSDA